MEILWDKIGLINFNRQNYPIFFDIFLIFVHQKVNEDVKEPFF